MKTIAITSVATTFVLAGCVRPPVPKEIVTRPETGEWTVVCDPDSVEIPPAIPIVTIKDGARYEGLLLVPGTAGYERILPYGRPSSVSRAYLQMPVLLKLSGGEWHLEVKQKSLSGSVVLRAETIPLAALVAVDPPGPRRAIETRMESEGPGGNDLIRR
jgi:hypothetical protein